MTRAIHSHPFKTKPAERNLCTANGRTRGTWSVRVKASRMRFAYPGLYCVFARVALGQMDSRMPYPGFAFEAVM